MKATTIISLVFAATSVLAAPVSDNSTSSSSNSTAKTILLTNDDGWALTNIRAAYRDLKAAGHEVIMVAPVLQRSGFGGQFQLPTTQNLTSDGGFRYPSAGSPSWGHEEDDLNVWYFNGTPASCVAFAVNYVLPTYFNNKLVDLVVAGPNEGTNLSPGMYTLSGTIGAAYNAVYRGLPSIAFSGSMTNNSFFKDDETHANDPNFGANILSKKVVELVNALFQTFKNRPQLLPITTGINVNFPPVGEDCSDPEYVFTRLSGPDSIAPSLEFNSTSGLPQWAQKSYEAITDCVFGDCSLPSESWLLSNEKCKSALSVFSVDYDAKFDQEQLVKGYLSGLFS